jgi:hypothetical protein
VEGDNCELLQNPNLIRMIICNNVFISHSANSLIEDEVYDVSATVYVIMERMASGMEAIIAYFKEIFKHLPEETK